MLQFDEAYYLAKNPDVAAAISAGHLSSALEHYQQNGFREGRDPHPFFDTSYYLETYPDVAAAGINPFDHFNSNGNSEGRAPNAFFDAAYYLEQNPDVAAAGIDPLEHYLGYGGREGRDPGPAFDSAHYNQQNPDVVAADLNPLAHYLAYGRDEGRVPHAQLGFYLSGAKYSDSAGFTVSGAGDINHDGFDDLIVTAPSAGFWGQTYVLYGNDQVFSSTIELNVFDGSLGFVVNGHADAKRIQAISDVGDFNGDGISDVIFGSDTSYQGLNFGAGAAYVLFGNNQGFDAAFDFTSLNGANGFVLRGIEKDNYTGHSVSGAGDVNGDGLSDVLIGAYNAAPGGRVSAGETYVVFGSAQGFDASMDLSALDGTNGFVINGASAEEDSGRAVSGAGDFNGDGIDDILIGAPAADPNDILNAGNAYVVYGSAIGFGASIELDSLDGTNGFVLQGYAGIGLTGKSLSVAGDVNGDGISDIVISAHHAYTNGNIMAGETYVVFGNQEGYGGSLDLSKLDGTNGFVLRGIDAEDWSGFSVSDAGDINGDGLADVLIGAPNADPTGQENAGETYLLFGNAEGFGPIIDLSSLNGENGYILNGNNANAKNYPGRPMYDGAGRSVTGAGDVNGDGIDDLMIGAFNSELGATSAGNGAYVVFGGETLGRFDALDGTSDGEIQLALIGHGYDL